MQALILSAILTIVLYANANAQMSVHLPIVQSSAVEQQTQATEYNAMNKEQFANALNYLLCVSFDGDSANDYLADFDKNSKERQTLSLLGDAITNQVTQDTDDLHVRVMFGVYGEQPIMNAQETTEFFNALIAEFNPTVENNARYPDQVKDTTMHITRTIQYILR